MKTCMRFRYENVYLRFSLFSFYFSILNFKILFLQLDVGMVFRALHNESIVC